MDKITSLVIIAATMALFAGLAQASPSNFPSAYLSPGSNGPAYTYNTNPTNNYYCYSAPYTFGCTTSITQSYINSQRAYYGNYYGYPYGYGSQYYGGGYYGSAYYAQYGEGFGYGYDNYGNNGGYDYGSYDGDGGYLGPAWDNYQEYGYGN
jgi:hypothetical protein